MKERQGGGESGMDVNRQRQATEAKLFQSRW